MMRRAAVFTAGALLLAACGSETYIPAADDETTASDQTPVFPTDPESVRVAVKNIRVDKGMTALVKVHFSENGVWALGSNSNEPKGNGGPYLSGNMSTPEFKVVDEPSPPYEGTYFKVPTNTVDVKETLTQAGGEDCESMSGTMTAVGTKDMVLTKSCDGEDPVSVWAKNGEPVFGDMTDKKDFQKTVRRLLAIRDGKSISEFTLYSGDRPSFDMTHKTGMVEIYPNHPAAPYATTVQSDMFSASEVDLEHLWKCAEKNLKTSKRDHFNVTIAVDDDDKLRMRWGSDPRTDDSCSEMKRKG